jgi:hypothetical protein
MKKKEKKSKRLWIGNMNGMDIGKGYKKKARVETPAFLTIKPVLSSLV